MADNNSWSSKKPSSWDKAKKQPSQPNNNSKNKGSWGSARPKMRQNSWGQLNNGMNMGPKMAGSEKHVVTRKGRQDRFDGAVERTKILYKVKTLYNRGSFPFNRPRIMPNENILQSRFEFLRQKGYALHDYQKEGVRYLTKGSRRLLADCMGLGKSVDFSTLLATPSGWHRAISIDPGDTLIGQHGKPVEVLNKYVWKNVDFYKMKFTDGTSIRCCGDHLWSVMRKGRAYRVRKKKGRIDVSDYHVMSTKDLAERSLVQVNKKGKGKNYNYYIPCVEPVQYDKKDFPIDPYILGVYLGEGWTTGKSSVCFAINENDNVIIGKIQEYFGFHNVKFSKKFSEELGRHTKCYTVIAFGKSAKTFIAALEEFGLKDKISLDKFIPEVYKFGSIEQRWNLLCGLMDTDGTLRDHSNDSSGGNSLNFGSSSYKLVHGIRELVLSLGGIARIGKPEYKSYNLNGSKVRTKNASWRVGIKLPDNKVPFTIPRQLDKYVPFEKYDKPYKNIESIEYIGKRDGVCFEVDEPNSLFVAQHYIVTHNTAQSLVSLPDHRVSGIIVVCPASVRRQWVDEKNRWRPEFYTLMPMKKNDFRWPNPGEMTILGWDSLPTIAPNSAPRTPVTLVLDEAHFAKNDGSVRHKRIMHFVNVCDVVIGLTGTPQPNTETDLWNVYRVCGLQHIPGDNMPLLGPRSRFGRTFYKWEKGEKRAVGAEWEIASINNMMCFRRTARDVCKNLPPVTFNKRDCTPTPQFAKQLDKFLEAVGGEQRLTQLLERAIRIHEDHGEVDDYLMALRSQIDMAKLPVLEEVVESFEAQGSQLVVFSPFRNIVEIMEKRPGWAAIKGGMSTGQKSVVQNAFNSGDIKWIALTSAGATGMDLPGPDNDPCMNLIRTSLDWSPATNDQVVKRIDRVAKKMALGNANAFGNINIYDLYLRHKIDEMVWQVIHKKRRVLGEIGFMADVDKSPGADPNYYNAMEERSDNVNIRYGFGGNNTGGGGGMRGGR